MATIHRRHAIGNRVFWSRGLTYALLLLSTGVIAGLDVTTLRGADVKYIYDELSRLRAVIDTAGETAIYSYDSVGNLLTITRQNSSIVSIIEVIPDSGPVGTPVTIYGTGFSSTASQNTVKFKTTVATVLSSTSTEIKTTVPAGAATGTISVTTPTRSATSSTTFTVAAAPGAPTISSFSPTIAASGTAVTINGTNFSTTMANNKVKTNLALAGLTSATAIKIIANVSPAGTPGHIKVTTPAGSVTSAGDLFIAPYGFAAADVGFTARMAIGETKSVALPTANKIGILIFDGTAGQNVSVNLGAGTIAGYSVSVNAPAGPQVVGVMGTSAALAVQPFSLPVTGTYSIYVDPTSTNVGTVPVTLNQITDVTGTIVPGGPPVTVTTTVPWQNARLTFSGTANQRVSLAVSTSGNTFGGFTTVSLLAPDGTTLATSSVYGSSGAFLDAVSLAVTGTYTVLIDPENANTGSMTLTAYDVPADPTATVVIGGPAVSLTTNVPGQNMKWNFTAAANQRVSYAMTNSSGSSAQVRILAQDGTLVYSSYWSTFNEPVTLPAAGSYSLVLDPPTNTIGTASLTLYDVPADVTGPIVAGGPPVTVTTTAPGQNASLTFNGTANELVSIAVSGSTVPGRLDVYLKKPDGTTLTSISSFGSSVFIEPQTLPTAGTYTIFLDPQQASVGSATVQLYDVPPDITGTIVPGGDAVSVTTTVPGQNVALTFTGAANQRVSLAMTNATYPYVGIFHVLAIKKPDGTTLASVNFTNGASAFVDVQTLPAAGTYTVLLNPAGAAVGNATLQLNDVGSDITGPIVPGGPPVTVTTTVPGQNVALTFTGAANQRVSLAMTNASYPYVGIFYVLAIKKPDGTTLASVNVTNGPTAFLDVQTLPVAGSYTVFVDVAGTAVGTATLQLYDVGSDITGPIVPGGAPVNVTTTVPGQNAALTFTGTANQQVSVAMTNATYPYVGIFYVLAIKKPDGTTLASVNFTNGPTASIATQTLPVAGTYTVFIDVAGTAVGTATLQLNSP